MKRKQVNYPPKESPDFKRQNRKKKNALSKSYEKNKGVNYYKCDDLDHRKRYWKLSVKYFGEVEDTRIEQKQCARKLGRRRI